MTKLTIGLTEKKHSKRVNKIRNMLEKGLREDAIISVARCTVEDIFEARKLLNTEATPETKGKSRLDTLVILESRGELTVFNLYAAEEIYKARLLKTSEVRCRTASVETRVDRKGNRPAETESEHAVRIQQQYNLWRAECLRLNVDANSCIHMIENQVTLKESDKHFGRRSGYTKAHLVFGLETYCFMFRPLSAKINNLAIGC